MSRRHMPLRDEHVQGFLQVATQAATRAGRLQTSCLNTPRTISFKGTRNLVTEVDYACEALIVKTVRSRYPDHDFLLEETHVPRQGSPFLWSIDPLDGTTNYAHGIPHFCCSISLEYHGTLIVGVVFDPLRKERFTAVRSKGSFLNGTRIRVSKEHELIRCLLATGFPQDRPSMQKKNLGRFERMLSHVQKVRCTGSAALDLCYVASGRLEGYWNTSMEHWDASAGTLIVQEAGGIVTDLDGHPPHESTRDFVASNGKIHERLLAILKGRRGTRAPG